MEETTIEIPSSLEEVSNFGSLQKLDNRARQIVALRSFGFSIGTIAKAWGLDVQEVRRLLYRYDPDNKLTLTKAARQAILTRLVETRVAEALAEITPEKLKDSSALDCATIAQKLNNIISEKTAPIVQKGGVDDIINRLKNSVELQKLPDGTYGQTEPSGQSEDCIIEGEQVQTDSGGCNI